MSLSKLIFRSMQFYWRGHLGVLLGTSLACAILTGALVVGDSVRFSLKQMALARLGQTTLALTASDRFFRAELAQELAPQLQAPIAPLLMLRGGASTPEGTRRANEVQVLGVDERFWNFSPAAVAGNQPTNVDASDEIAISESLASRLQLKLGDPVVVRLESPSMVTRDLPLAGQPEASVAMRLRVRNIVGEDKFGRFSLQGNQVAALSVFLPLNALQAQIQRPERANVLLVGQQGSPHGDAVAANAALAKVWTLADADLELRELPESTEFELRTKRVFLDPVVANAAFAVASNADSEMGWGGLGNLPVPLGHWPNGTEQSLTRKTAVRTNSGALPVPSGGSPLGTGGSPVPPTGRTAATSESGSNAMGVLTYFVNEIRLGEHATPYSFIAATTHWAPTGIMVTKEPTLATNLKSEVSGKTARPHPSPLPQGEGDTVAASWPGTGVPLREDEITINAWLADDLGAKPGSEVTVRYFVLGERRELQEQTATFRVRDIIPLKSDPSWMPEFPGLADAENCREWKPGIPINLDRIRPKDEAYWSQYRGTPKAFVTLAAGQKLWANRFGNLTAIRFPSGSQTAAAATKEFERALLKNIDPAALGFSFTEVRERALQASEKSQDFGQLFIGFGFFLILAALLLTALLFVFQLEQRNAEAGLLRALGFSNRKVCWVFLTEGACVAGLGSLLGLLGGVAVTKLTLCGLATVWRGAVGTSDFLFHAEASSLLTGAGLSLGAAIGAMALAQRGQTRRSLASLLASGAEVELGGAGARGWRAHLGLGIGVVCSFGTLVLMAFGGRGQGPEMAEVFFCSGLLMLCAGLGFTQRLLVGLPQATKVAHSLAQLGWRNAGRRRTRSLTTVSVLAVGVFMVVAVSAFRQNPRSTAWERHSGTGGFALYGQSTLPIYEDLNTARGREAFHLSAAAMNEVAVVPLRIREGDDASCLNLNRALQPRLLSVRPDELKGRQAFTFGQSLDQKGSAGTGTAAHNPDAWDLLNQQPAIGVIPAIGDEQTVRWALGKSLGDTIAYTDDRGRSFQVQIVGILANSILQGGLLISEPNFIERFSSVAGYRAFLVDAPPGRTEAVAELLTRQLQDKGLEVQPAWQRLADFMAVENTYLGIFQALGGLGLLLGSLGLGIVVLRNVLERRNEMALLQAVGFRSSQLQRLVLSEHWLLVVLGLAIGLGAALLAVSPALRFSDGAAPSGTMALILVALAVAGLFWCWLATRAALRGPLLETLRKE